MSRRVAAWLAALCFLSGGGLTGADDPGKRQIFSFESPDDLTCVQTSGKGAACRTTRHFRSGENALEWRYQAGERLTLRTRHFWIDRQAASREMGSEAAGALIFYLYQEKPQPGKTLRVEFSRGAAGKADCRFEIRLDFTGWRGGYLVYDRDMEGKPHPEMDHIRLIAPDCAGELFLDDLIPCTVMDTRFQEPDLQLPFVRKGVPYNLNDAQGNPWLTTHLKPVTAPVLTPAEQAGFRVAEQRLDEDFNGEEPPVISSADVPEKLKVLQAGFDRFGIRRHPDGRVTGRPIFFVIHSRFYQQVEKGRDIARSFVPIRVYGTFMLNLAQNYRRSSDPAFRRQLGEWYEAMLLHLLDQGYVYGSSLGTRVINGYGTRELFGSFLLMRDFLAEKGFRETIFRMGQWHFDLNASLDEQFYSLPNADQFNINMRSMLICILMLPDSPEKAARLAGFSRFFSRNLGWKTPGWMGGFKPDGMVFHHWGHYPSYIFGALSSAARICYVLSGTPWAVTPEAFQTLKNAVAAADIYCMSDTALPLHGRIPFRPFTNAPVIFAARTLGKAGDGEMAALYRRIGGRKAAQDKLFRKVKAAPRPAGHWSFNYAAMGVHRFKNKAVTLKTFNHYVWAYETYRGTNLLGRYLSNGSMDIMTHMGADAAGRLEKGWDWARIPGTTALNRPWDVLQAPPELRAHMPTMIGNRINGSSNLEGRYGAFGSVLAETEPPPRFDPSFRAVKSVFAFEDRLIALGSSIASKTVYPVETTLFQYALSGKRSKDRPVYLNGTPQTGSADEILASPCLLADAMGNGWYVVQAGGKVRVRRGVQHSRNHRDLSPEQGEFATAWLDHGIGPENAGYEYLVLLDFQPSRAEELQKALQKSLPYRVLRRDAQVHAVRDLPSGVTAAVFFEAQPELNWELLRSVKNPSYLLWRHPDKNTLHLSINTPDLADFVREGFSDLPEIRQDAAQERLPRQVSITLAGHWRLLEDVAGVAVAEQGGGTVISGTFRHGMAKQLKLQKY